MAIISFHPAKKKIIDFRKTGKSYYVAKCDKCGRTFYPNRKTARFCNVSCANSALIEKKFDARFEEE